MLTDPLTLLELGSSAIAAGGKAVAKESTEASLKNLTNNTVLFFIGNDTPVLFILVSV